MSFQWLKSGRFWLCGPAVFLLSILIMLGMAVWFPKGAAQIDNIVLPLLGFPLIWALFFFYSYLERSLKRAWCVCGLVFVAHLVLLVHHMSGGGA